MGLVGLRVWWCCFLAMEIIAVAAARNTIFLSDKAEVIVVGVEMAEVHGKSLKLSLNDYSETSANNSHEPKNKGGGGSSSTRVAVITRAATAAAILHDNI
ncbi:hypothetical protein NE237_008671 [Protea cynaroides]|uniref:Secreted protein n=1 Tax=Protea cynaroides TaxID=273540 RepID=A0A9Q0KWB3_9MAGN|nr:hypothetical protein NE237_008671 [Protea cynaroides]